MHSNPNTLYGTTVLCVRKNNKTVMAADGQASLGNMVMKSNVKKIRKLMNDKVLAGFAGATADAFALIERLEGKLEKHPGQLTRACVELAKDWRTDRYLRRLEAMMIVADADTLLMISGTGDVIEPEDGIAAIGSGGFYALAAARALIDIKPDQKDLSAEDVVRKSMQIAGDICVFTNHNLTLETL